MVEFGPDSRQSAFDELPAILWMTDRDGRLAYRNALARQFFAPDIDGDANWVELIHDRDRRAVRTVVERRIEAGAKCAVEFRIRPQGGDWRWLQAHIRPMSDDDGAFAGHLAVAFDVTATRRHEAQLMRLATHDKMTGLPAREMLERLIDRAIEQAAADGLSVPVVAFGFDRFQTVNEAFGHETGDALLRQLGERLDQAEAGGSIGCISGNRFILVGAPGSPADEAAERVKAISAEPFQLGDMRHELSVSSGIALYPDDGQTAEALLSAAEAALQAAKQSGGAATAFSDPEEQASIKERFDLEQDLRLAISRDELMLYYQPKVSMRSGRLSGFEALVRWQHPRRGLLGPDLFIAIAEQANLMKPLTLWAFNTAGRQIREWIDAGLKPVPIAVNATPREFVNGLIEEHLPAYHAHGLPRGLLEVEITESTMIGDFAEISAIVEALKPHGIKVAMDDFGTGYSSLAGLNKLPIATLKIDKSFTQDLHSDRSSRAVASCIVAIAKELGLKVVAEGVETEDQLEVLRGMRCHLVQGFLTGRPMPAEAAGRLLARAPARKPRRRRTPPGLGRDARPNTDTGVTLVVV